MSLLIVALTELSVTLLAFWALTVAVFATNLLRLSELALLAIAFNELQVPETEIEDELDALASTLVEFVFFTVTDEADEASMSNSVTAADATVIDEPDSHSISSFLLLTDDNEMPAPDDASASNFLDVVMLLFTLMLAPELASTLSR